MQKPKVVFLDWYKTLSISMFWDNVKMNDRPKYELINRSFLALGNDLINSWMRGGETAEEISAKIAEMSSVEYAYVYQNLKLSAENMQFAEIDTLKLVGSLRNKGIKVIIATDNMDTFSKWTVPYMDLRTVFDEILNSWDNRSLKRDFSGNKSLFFSDFLTTNNIKPEECILIDDAEDHSGSLSKFGIRYLRVSSTKEVPVILSSLI